VRRYEDEDEEEEAEKSVEQDISSEASSVEFVEWGLLAVQSLAATQPAVQT